jgi:hypothetical protein
MFKKLRSMGWGGYVLGCGMLCVLACILLTVINRWSAEITRPQAPLYSSSECVRVSEPASGCGLVFSGDKCTASASPEELVEFYENRGDCWRSEVGNVVKCEGKALPLGTYTIYIDFDSYEVDSSTSYDITIIWHKCTWELY